ncbi:hypothetical protein XBLMG947_1979 [Xanthomonas bromi]|uniref:DUF4279 domain-containing protein n=1 Tax=Xanthomonas bromi TaxID=56449 RepID=A0A1C3NL92_9XANT|nr:DUF4279 domain-containing protein [Xanthomonas bromi]SBV51193.1 hypothetical protein XBLMG947_1979 [Xanthomonas bromi]
MTEDSYKISLRIWHPTSSSSTIVDEVGLKSNFLQSVGDRRKNPNGNELDGFYKQSYCTFSIAEKVCGCFVDGLNSALPLLKEKRDYFSQVRREGGRLDLFVGVFVESSSGFILKYVDMGALADLGIDLSVEFYI